MNSTKTGVWMDNSHAIFVDPYSIDPEFEILMALHTATTKTKGGKTSITSFSHDHRSNNELKMHNKEISDEKHYMKILTDRLRNYDEVFLLGPTDASRQLYGILLQNTEFKNKKISWEKSDKLTDNQLLARVQKHFFNR